MLQIIRHLFYASEDLLVPLTLLPSQDMGNQNLSRISNNAKKPQAKKDTLGDKLLGLWSQIYDELGSETRFNEILCETLRCMITFAAQSHKYKNVFGNNLQPATSAKKGSLLKQVTDKLLTEGLNTNTQRLRLTFTLLRTLSMSGEIAKELLKLKVLEDLLAKILPVCKNEKDVKVMRHYLSYLAAFLAAFSTTEDG